MHSPSLSLLELSYFHVELTIFSRVKGLEEFTITKKKDQSVQVYEVPKA